MQSAHKGAQNCKRGCKSTICEATCTHAPLVTHTIRP
jgi:hypothetical protein